MWVQHESAETRVKDTTTHTHTHEEGGRVQAEIPRSSILKRQTKVSLVLQRDQHPVSSDKIAMAYTCISVH